MAEKRKLKGIADLYFLEDALKQAPSEATNADSTPLSTPIPSQTIVEEAMLSPTIPSKTISRESKAKRSIVTQNIPFIPKVDESRGYYATYNDLSDRLIPELKLNPFEQAVLNRLYRLSRGWKTEECEVGLGTLSRFCVMSKSQVQRSLNNLIEKGLIENLGEAKKGGREGNRYRVLPGTSSIPKQTIVSQGTVPQNSTIPTENTVVMPGIVQENNNKHSNKDLLNKHTNTKSSVAVNSQFTLEECQRYAEHLHITGQGITNPGGFALSIHRSGVADTFIERFLQPPEQVNPFDASQCPDCKGTGFWYPQGFGQPVAKCKHKQLLTPNNTAPLAEQRLAVAEMFERASLIAELLKSGYTLEQAEAQFADSFHPEDWIAIKEQAMSQLDQKSREASSDKD